MSYARIGIYGIPGAGKTTLMKMLEIQFPAICFVEGSDFIKMACAEKGFKSIEEVPVMLKPAIRTLAIEMISFQYQEFSGPIIVTGHYSFLDQESTPYPVFTGRDSTFYDTILYLDVASNQIYRQRETDRRKRPALTEKVISEWVHFEKAGLKKICEENEILFSVCRAETIIQLCNDLAATHQITLLKNISQVYILDGDKTISIEDTGKLFWCKNDSEKHYPLKEIFADDNYQLKAFKKATDLYDNLDLLDYNALCKKTATAASIRSEWEGMFKKWNALGCNNLVVIASSGIREVWEHIIRSNIFLQNTLLIAGNRSEHGYVVNGETKAFLIKRVRSLFPNAKVTAFGDSLLDIQMLKEADQGYLVTAQEISKTGKKQSALRGSKIVQLAIGDVKDRLFDFLPVTSLEWINDPSECVFEYTMESFSKVLSSNMRDANVKGLELQKYHRQCGFYLGTKLVNSLGIQKTQSRHVTGGTFEHYKPEHWSATLIVCLMRGVQFS